MQNTKSEELIELTQVTGNTSPELSTTGKSTPVGYTSPAATPPMPFPTASTTDGFFCLNRALAQSVAHRAHVKITGFAAPHGK